MKKTALVTGASWGIGRELAVLCAQNGMDLALVARSKERLEELADELSSRYAAESRVLVKDLAETGL